MKIAEKLLPNPEKNIPYLDAIRGIAVLFVLTRHAWGLSWSPSFHVGAVEFGRFITMMSSGVDLFFVLSGVLLSRSFLRANADGRPSPIFWEYMSARILRIGPPYWIVLFLVILLYVPAFIPQERVWSNLGLASIAAHLVFAQSLFIFSFGAYTVGTPFWTLTVEMVFYLFLPIAVRAFYNDRWWQGVLGAMLLSMIWLYMCRYQMNDFVELIKRHSFGMQYGDAAIRFFLSHQILGYLPHFAIGISIAAILQRRTRRTWASEKMGIVYFSVGITILLSSMYILGGISVNHDYSDPTKYMSEESSAALAYYYFESLPFAISYGLIVLGCALAPQRMRDIVSAVPLLCLFGVLGYSIYLIHMPLLYTMNNHWWIASDIRPAWHFAKLLVPGGLVIVLLSLGMFYGIERPSMIWASRRRKPAIRVG